MASCQNKRKHIDVLKIQQKAYWSEASIHHFIRIVKRICYAFWTSRRRVLKKKAVESFRQINFLPFDKLSKITCASDAYVYSSLEI